MRFIKTVCVVLCTALLMTILPGCGEVDNSRRVNKITLPDDKMISSQISFPYAEVTLMLYDDGTFSEYASNMDDKLDLLAWELRLTEDYFNNLKAEYRELAATSTTTDIPMGTVEDYEQYEGVSYEEYLEDKIDALKVYKIKDHFDEDTYKLINRPSERVKISFMYFPEDHEKPLLNKEQVVKYYKKILKYIAEDPEFSKYVLDTVNLDSYKTGKELRELSIHLDEEDGNELRIYIYPTNVSWGTDYDMCRESVVKLK